jgi:integrase/recombinase XerD
LIEDGTYLRYIQEILKQNSVQNAKTYTNVSTKNIQQIKSPFDDL